MTTNDLVWSIEKILNGNNNSCKFNRGRKSLKGLPFRTECNFPNRILPGNTIPENAGKLQAL